MSIRNVTVPTRDPFKILDIGRVPAVVPRHETKKNNNNKRIEEKKLGNLRSNRNGEGNPIAGRWIRFPHRRQSNSTSATGGNELLVSITRDSAAVRNRWQQITINNRENDKWPHDIPMVCQKDATLVGCYCLL